MAIVSAHEDIKDTRKHRAVEGGKSAWSTYYMRPADERPQQPQASFIECGPRRVLRTHFHRQDQFQVFVSGEGSLGKHAIRPFQVHFARANTPYGPIVTEDGVGFLTLRTRKDPGAHYLPEMRDVLANIEGRKPWQLTLPVEFPDAADPISVKPIEEMRDDRGLAAYVLSMKPNGVAPAPDPSKSYGQYIVVLGGSILHESREHKATTIIWVAPNEGPFTLQAGPEGLRGIALNFPQPHGAGPRRDEPTSPAAPEPDYKVWQCALCAFIYDEARGLPGEGIPPGTRWAHVPEDWGCPDCSAKKADFRMTEI